MADAAGHAARHPGAVLGVARFFHDPRGSMRGMLDSRPGEGRLSAYALGAAAILLAGRAVATLAAGPTAVEPAGIVAAQVVSLPFVVLVYYALAALGSALARLAGGSGIWRDGRAAFFWAALVSAPVVVLTGLLPLAMPGAPLKLLVVVAQVGPVFFAWALAQCYAEAFGFRRAWAVFAVIAGLVLLILGAAWAAGI